MLLLNSHLTYYACVSSQPIEAWSYVVRIRQVICKRLDKCFKLSNTSRVQVAKNICDIGWWGRLFRTHEKNTSI